MPTSTIRVSIAKLSDEDPAAVALVRLCALMRPGPIPLTLFAGVPAELLDPDLDPAATNAAALRLCVDRAGRHGLLRVDGDIILMPQPVARAVRADLSPEAHRAGHTFLATLALATGEPDATSAGSAAVRDAYTQSAT